MLPGYGEYVTVMKNLFKIFEYCIRMDWIISSTKIGEMVKTSFLNIKQYN